MQRAIVALLATLAVSAALPEEHEAGSGGSSDCLVLGDWATNHSTAAAQMNWVSLDMRSPLWCCQGGGAPGVQVTSPLCFTGPLTLCFTRPFHLPAVRR